jgi:hypothetical protein
LVVTAAGFGLGAWVLRIRNAAALERVYTALVSPSSAPNFQLRSQLKGYRQARDGLSFYY